MKYKNLKDALSCLCIMIACSCEKPIRTVAPTMRYILPNEIKVSLSISTDSLSLPLDEETYNDVRTYNTFLQDDNEYLWFYERRSESVNFYNIKLKQYDRKILLRNVFGPKNLYKTSVYCKSFDSIFVINRNSFYLINHQGSKIVKIKGLDYPEFSYPYFSNSNKPVVRSGKVYVAVKMLANEASIANLLEWKVLYEFDCNKKEARLYYNLPKTLTTKYYGRRLLNQSFCSNNKGYLVFSFNLDTLLYETDLSDYHVSYNAKPFQYFGPYNSISKEDLQGEKRSMAYYNNNTYSAIHYDGINDRYLRICHKRLSAEEYNSKKVRKQQRVLILDNNFQIIGDTQVDPGLYITDMSISDYGEMYVRVSHKSENSLTFLKINYSPVTKDKILSSNQ